MTTPCIDLKQLAGKRYRLDYDPARQKRDDDPWLLTIPCRHGHIYPHSAELLGIATNTRTTGLKLAKLPGVEMWQDGDDGCNLTFPPHVFAKVASVVKPKRRKVLSEEQRQKLAEAGKATRIRAKSQGVQCSKSGQIPPRAASVDTLAV
jgi:hypothetical protein